MVEHVKVEFDVLPDKRLFTVGDTAHITYRILNTGDNPIELKMIDFGAVRGFKVYEQTLGNRIGETLTIGEELFPERETSQA